jgi:hypothetical protein
MPSTEHTTTDDNHNANTYNRESLVFAVANTDPSPQVKAPAWFLELTHQLRNFRQWRLIIKPDQTIDFHYLASLALQAHRRARAYSVPLQPTLFQVGPPEPERTIDPNPTNCSEQPAINQTDSNLEITGNNHPFNLNAILLPNDILTIEPHEFLHDYLGRVAAAAVQAAISTCGSPDAAFIRLGSKPPQDHTVASAAPRPTLVLAPPRAKPLKRNS